MNNKQHSYPLHDAIVSGDTSLIEQLIKKGQDVNESNQYDFTPLYTLAGCYLRTPNSKENTIIIAKQLLEAGADPNIGSYTHKQALPLYEAVRYGKNPDLVNLLLSYHANTHQRLNGYTPLILAIRRSFPEITRLLLLKADPTLSCRSGCSPLSHAINRVMYNNQNESELQLKYLLMHPKISPHEKGLQNNRVNLFIKSIIYGLLYAYTDKEKYSIVQSGIITVIRAFVFAGFNLHQDSPHYSESAVKQSICINTFQKELNNNGQELQEELPDLYQILQDKRVFSSIILKEIFPFIKGAIEQAETLKADEQAKLGFIKNPQIIKQFLLASDEEKAAILKKTSELEAVLGYPHTTITTRFLLSSAQDRKDFLYQIKWKHHLCKPENEKDLKARYKYTKHFSFKDIPLLATAALIFPKETFDKICEYLLPNPNRTFISTEATLPAEKEDNIIESDFASLRMG